MDSPVLFPTCIGEWANASHAIPELVFLGDDPPHFFRIPPSPVKHSWQKNLYTIIYIHVQLIDFKTIYMEIIFFNFFSKKIILRLNMFTTGMILSSAK